MTRIFLPAAQRKEDDAVSSAPSIDRAPSTDTGKPTADAHDGAFIVDDDTNVVGRGQMKKSEFLDALRSSACHASDEALARVGRSTDGCPFVEQWFDRYRDKSAAYLEKALRRYAPEAKNASSARDYIPVVSSRVARGVASWVDTGNVPDLPEGMSAGALGLGGGIFGAIAGLFGGLGGTLFKRRPGAPRRPAARAEIGTGRPLDPGVRARMEPVFGHDFSHVRIHTGNDAAQASDQLFARAFTVGRDIAFARDEYQPGTPIGDALIAHELAHVVQQSGAPAHAPLAKGDTEDQGLEDEADDAAASAVVSIWTGLFGASGARGSQRGISSSVKRGLRLQRCKKDERAEGSPFDPKNAPDPKALAAEAAEKQASDARRKANPGIYDPGLFPDVTFDFASETYLYDFRWPAMEIDGPCQGSFEASGCTTLAQQGSIATRLSQQKQKVGTVDVEAPVVVPVRGPNIRVTMVIPRDQLNTHTLNHELQHVVDAYEILQQTKAILARRIRLKIMDAWKKVGSNPQSWSSLVSAQAIVDIAAAEFDAMSPFLKDEITFRAGPVDKADPATPPAIPPTFPLKIPRLVPDATGSLT